MIASKELEEEKKSTNDATNNAINAGGTPWKTCTVDDLYNILPFECTAIDIREQTIYKQAHLLVKSKYIDVNLENIVPEHSDHDSMNLALQNTLSGKASIVPSRNNILKHFVVISSGGKQQHAAHTFIHSIFVELKSKDSALTKYALYFLSDSFDVFAARYPFYCRRPTDPDNDEPFEFHPNCILRDKLYLGAGSQAQSASIINNLKITHIANVTKHIACQFPDTVQYLHIKVDDSAKEQLDAHFEAATDFIHAALLDDDKDNVVFVHCEMGVSRSASMVIAYLMRFKKMTLHASYEHLRRCRSIIHPNDGFFEQLIAFEKKLYGKSTYGLIHREINVEQKATNLRVSLRGLRQALNRKKQSKLQSKAT